MDYNKVFETICYQKPILGLKFMEKDGSAAKLAYGFPVLQVLHVKVISSFTRFV